MIVCILLMSVINLLVMTWFLYKFSYELHETNTRKVLCLICENIYFMYMIVVFFKIEEPEEFFAWLRQFCLLALAIFVLNEFLEYLIVGRVSLSFSKTEYRIDPIARIYIRLWERMYIESFVLSVLGSVLAITFAIYQCITDYYEERKKLDYFERYFARIQYQGGMEQKCCAICLADYEL
jgi:hypothetical protein